MQYALELERNRKQFFFSLCCLIVFFVFCGFLVINYLQKDSLEILIDVLVLLIMGAGFMAVRKLNADTTVYFIVHCLISLLLLYAVSIGAGNATAIFWVFFMPLLFFFFFSKRQGLIWTIVFLSAVALIMLFPRWFHGYVYNNEIRWRFFVTLITITFFSYGLESARYAFSKLFEEKHQKLVKEKGALDQALKEIKTLSGLIPICSNCKKIRNDKGYWEQVEIYMAKHTDAAFSHGICPDCIEILYPMLKNAP